MKKYIFIAPSLSKGGAERVASILANELVKKGRIVYFIIHFYTKETYYLDNRIKLICLSDLEEEKYRNKISIFYLIKLLKKLRKEVLKISPDYIIPFLWTTCIRTKFSLFFTKYSKKIIYTVRNNPAIFPKNRIIRAYRNHLILHSKTTIVQNKEQAEYFNNKDNIKIIPNPVEQANLNIIRNVNNNSKFRIIGVGRLNYQKNFDFLISSICELISEGLKIELLIYGDGEERAKLQELIADLKMDEYIFLKGRCNSFSEIYGNANVFVLSSKFEGMPNTLLEAMGCGVPSISTNCPTGPTDIIKDGVDGFLIDVGNKEQLKAKIKYLYENKDVCEFISNNAKNKIKTKYNKEIIINTFIEDIER